MVQSSQAGGPGHKQWGRQSLLCRVAGEDSEDNRSNEGPVPRTAGPQLVYIPELLASIALKTS